MVYPLEMKFFDKRGGRGNSTQVGYEKDDFYDLEGARMWGQSKKKAWS